MSEEVLETVQRLRPIADEIGLSMAQLAVAWVLMNPNVSSAIIGASRPDQIRLNAQAVQTRLEAATLARIEAAVGAVAERDPRKTASPEQRVV